MMLFGVKLDVIEEEIKQYESALLNILLFDRTSRKNIIWATDSYSYLGEDYSPYCTILPRLITGDNTMLIQPRIAKSLAAQDSRTKDIAEVFTPSWICNKQNNLVDEQWFGRLGVFNTEHEHLWTVNEEKIPFSENGTKTWKNYVDAKRLEISCGEAPYLVSRYDTVTGEPIPPDRRIGLLDRKLRVINENTVTKDDWLRWTERAFQSIYGYEYQGDNLLLARENLLLTYIDYYLKRFHHAPGKAELMRISRIISWNIWQMDGMKYVIPLSCKPIVYEEYTLFGTLTNEEPCLGCSKKDIYSHTGIYCRVYDWRKKNSYPFISLIKGEKS